MEIRRVNASNIYSTIKDKGNVVLEPSVKPRTYWSEASQTLVWQKLSFFLQKYRQERAKDQSH